MKVFVTGGGGFIGVNLIGALLNRGDLVMNYDLRPPLNDRHISYWRKGDIMCRSALREAMAEFQPDWVIHLAARVECDEGTTVEEGYKVNTIGSKNLLDAVSSHECVDRLIVTSSQFVCGPERLPEGDEDYFPHTVYGASKVETERITRSAKLTCCWTLIRPTNVWGAYHERYTREFWRILKNGLYFHPDVPAPLRSYAYVMNVVDQILAILESPREVVDRQTFYVGDAPIRIDRWIEGFHKAITGKQKMRRVPFPLIRMMALAGDGISAITRRPFYINSSRLRSMTEDYPTPMEKTFAAFGQPRYTLEEGIAETAKWYLSADLPGEEKK